MSVLSKSHEAPSRSWFLIYGPPKAGKTGTSATASEQCPPLPSKELVELSDIVYLQYDVGGVEALKDVGVSAPYVDLSGLSFRDLITTEREALKEVGQGVADGKIKTVVIDTLTARDNMLGRHFQAIHADDKTPYKMYGNIKSAHLNFGTMLEGLPAGVRVLLLCHARENSTIDDNIKVKQAANQAVMADIKPALTGGAANYYIGSSTLFWLQLKKRKGQPAVRTFVTGGSMLYQVGGRGENRLDEEEPANLSAIFKKLGI